MAMARMMFCFVMPAIALTLLLDIRALASTEDRLKEWEDKRTKLAEDLKATTSAQDRRKIMVEIVAADAAIRAVKGELAAEYNETIRNSNVPPEEPLGKKCHRGRPTVGDLSYIGLDNWSVGTTVSAQLIRYTFGTKQAAINTGLGAGVSFRYYGSTPIGDVDTVIRDEWPQSVQDLPVDQKSKQIKLPIYQIASECRATTADVGQGKKLASPIFSISPVLYAGKLETVGELNIQPAIQIGILNDLINIGTGFNLTGQDKGKVFLLFSLGYGFKF